MRKGLLLGLLFLIIIIFISACTRTQTAPTPQPTIVPEIADDTNLPGRIEKIEAELYPDGDFTEVEVTKSDGTTEEFTLQTADGNEVARQLAQKYNTDTNTITNILEVSTEEEEEESASEHFTEAGEALDKGDRDAVRHHLEEAVEAAERENLAEAKEHAEEALDALDKNNLDSVREHIEEGLTASGGAAEEEEEEQPQTQENVVEITSSGFNPKSLSIDAGDKVTFVNKDSKPHWPASDVHPTHGAYPESGGCIGSKFDACKGLAEGERFLFTFDERGSWDYHDHLNPRESGTIVVE